jgi:Lrp/AsnC family leucine-responsive transcriptional regulator
MDDTDRRILTALLADARTSYADLARQVGLSSPAVQDRVRKLEREGVLQGSAARLDAKRLGLGVSALVGLQQREGVDADDIVAGLTAVPEIEDCWFVAGDEAFLVKVRVADLEDLDRTLRVLRHVPGVTRTRTTVVLHTPFEGRRRVPSSGGMSLRRAFLTYTLGRLGLFVLVSALAWGLSGLLGHQANGLTLVLLGALGSSVLGLFVLRDQRAALSEAIAADREAKAATLAARRERLDG